MSVKNRFAILLFFSLLALFAADLTFARGIIETPSWETIEISGNFIWYNILYNQKGEKTGLKETITPMYGQDIVVVYRAENLENGKSARISVYDSDMGYVFSRTVIIENGEVRAEVRLLTNRQKMESLITEAGLQYFCIVDLPNSKKIRSEKINVNFTVNMDIEAYEQEFAGDPDAWDYEFHLESTDGEYKQGRNVLRDGMVYGKYRIQRLTYTDILLNKNYNIIARLLDGSELYASAYNLNILDFFEYYDEPEQDSPEFMNLIWENDGSETSNALIGSDVTLSCEARNIAEGETIKFSIFAQGKNKDDLVDEVEGRVMDGRVQVLWEIIFKGEKGSNADQEIEEQRYTIPVYYFTAQYGGVESARRSQPLVIRNFALKRLMDEDTGEIFRNTKYAISLSDGSVINGITDDDGYMEKVYLENFSRIVDIKIE
jgi:hypothetical protein